MLADQCEVASYNGYGDRLNGFQFIPDPMLLELADANPALERQLTGIHDVE